MKIKSIAAICKKRKCVFLYDKKGEDYTSQWVSDGSAIYPIINIPYMETDNLCTIFEFTEKQQKDFMIRHAAIPEGISLEDTDYTEKILQSDNISISYAGRLLKPLYTSKGMIFIDSNYLSPLVDIWSIMELYERTAQSGQTYIVAKSGFLLYAVIMPYEVLNETFLKAVEKLACECRIAYDRKENSRIEAMKKEPQQQAIVIDGGMVDQETGEIMEMVETDGESN